MNLQRKAQGCAATVRGCSSRPSSQRLRPQTATQSLDGLWLTDGYGALVEFLGDKLQTNEITTLSCIPSAKAARKPEIGVPNGTVFAGDDDTFRIYPGTSPDTRWVHVDGASRIFCSAAPAPRPSPVASALWSRCRRKMRLASPRFIENKYISGGMRDFCNRQLQFGLLRPPQDTAL